MKLYPYQETCVNFAIYHQYSLNGSEMGTGKTIVALETAKRVGKRTLIIGPAFLHRNWDNECKRYGITNYKYVRYSEVHKVYEKDIRDCRFWIVDESHYLKNPQAMRTHAVYSLLKKCLPEYFLALSGTPLKNKVPDLWTLLAICSNCPTNTVGLRLEGEMQKYRAFSRYFCNIEMIKMRGRTIEKFTGVRKDRVPELKALLKDKYIAFKVADVLQDLPTMTRKNVDLGLKVVPGLEEAFKAYIEGSKLDPTSKATSALLKSAPTVTYVKDILECGESVIVFSDHIASAKAIAEGLECPCVTGQMDADDRASLVDRFQAGEFKVLVATIGALSVGVTLTKARHVVFNDLSWSHSDNLQAEKRIHRIGQKDACFSHYMIASPTDEYIVKTITQKMDTVLRVLG